MHTDSVLKLSMKGKLKLMWRRVKDGVRCASQSSDVRDANSHNIITHTHLVIFTVYVCTKVIKMVLETETLLTHVVYTYQVEIPFPRIFCVVHIPAMP